MTHRRITVLAIAACAMLLVAASVAPSTAAPPGSRPTIPPPPPTTTSEHGKWPGSSQPPPFLVRYGDHELALYAYTFCYGPMCADGFDDNPPSVGSPDWILVYASPDDWNGLSVTQSTSLDAEQAGRVIRAKTKNLGDGWWQIALRGKPDTYRVTLFAQGDGDMIADLIWDKARPGGSPGNRHQPSQGKCVRSTSY